MTKDFHDATFKTLMTQREYFVDFCLAYLPSDIKQRLDFGTLRLFKANVEYTEQSVDNEGLQSRQADIIYQVNYEEGEKSCFISIHIEHMSEPDKTLPMRILNYNSSFLLEHLKTNPHQGLPAMVNIVYYHHQRSPYPYSLDIYDLFEDKALAKQYLLTIGLVDLKKMPDEALAEHGVLYPMEALFKLTPGKGLEAADFEVFFKAIIELKDNEIVRKSISVLLKYATNALNYEYEPFIEKLTEITPEWGDMMATMAQELREQGMQAGIQKGIEKGKEAGITEGMKTMSRNIVMNMIKEGLDPKLIAKTSGMKLLDVEALIRKLDSDVLH